MESVLVTGGAGFIGFHLCQRLLDLGFRVTAVDDLNSYYDPILKKSRLSLLKNFKNLEFHKIDISIKDQINPLICDSNFTYIFHLAAQAGVRYSFENPDIYFKSNVEGTYNILESIKTNPNISLIFTSTSSIYGDSKPLPFKENNNLQPIQFYAFTKKINEELIQFYSKQFSINAIVFRLFTVYGPWGRPDMALFKFTDSILNNIPIEVYNNANHKRSFTYVDDVIDYLVKALSHTNKSGFNIYNLGSSNSVDLAYFIKILTDQIGLPFSTEYKERQKGDMLETMPDSNKLFASFGQIPFTPIEVGVKKFLDWHKLYFESKWAGRGSNPEPTD